MDAGPRIAIDAMGGDTGPAAMIAGASRALRKDPALQFTFYGDEAAGRAPSSAGTTNLARRRRVVHSPEVDRGQRKAEPGDPPRPHDVDGHGDQCGQGAGHADAALSGGNTGALMAMSKLALRTMPGIDRPALAALLPTLGETDVIMLDLGANTECDAQNLVQFAVMGSAYARTVLELAKPRVKLLNIGTEELKGTDELKDAAALLREADYLPIRFDGFTEGDQLSRGEVDVVVTDGFSGNIALKTAEGTARFVTDLLRRAFKSSLRSKAGFALSRPALNLLKVHLDPNNHNGAVFLGLNGLVVKSHGGANPKGVANAIRVAASMVRNDITRKIGDDLDNFRAHAFANGRRQVKRSVVLGVGSALPKREVTNEELAQEVDTTDEWIVERTGIRSRYIAGEGETTASLATDAARRALDDAGHRRGGHRPHRACDRNSRPDLPVVGDQGSGGAGHSRLHRLRRPRGLHRLPLCAVGRQFDASLGQREKGAGDRRGDVQPDPRLGRPRRRACCSATAPARSC